MQRLPPAPAPKFGYYDKLSPERRRFIDEYLIDLNASAAALRAGYTNYQSGFQLLNTPDVQKAISERRELVANERGLNGSLFVLGKLWDVATADPRELAEVRRVPCRFCWGINGGYQFTKSEMDRLVRAYEYGSAKQPFTALWPTGPAERAAYVAGAHKIAFDPQGGDGYTTQRDANPACAECGGIGITLHYVGDTRKLSDKGRQLYRGLKVGNNKIEVLMADQDAAMMALAKHYRVATERRDVFLRTINPNDLTNDELLQAIAELQAIDLEREDFKTIEITNPSEPGVPADVKRRRRQASMARASEARRRMGNHRPR